MRAAIRSPQVLFALLAALLVGSWAALQLAERRVLDTRLELTSRHVAARLEALLGASLAEVERLGAALEDAPAAPSEAGFRAAARDLLAREPSMQALNWVDASGTIAWVEPEEGNAAARGFDLTGHPLAGPSLAEAAASGELVVTPPLELLQRGYGIAAYLRVDHGGETAGHLDAVFRVPVVLELCITADERADLAFVLSDGSRPLGALGPMDAGDAGDSGGAGDEAGDSPSVERGIRVAQRELVLTVSAARRVAARGTWVDEAQLALGLALAAVLVRLVHVARARRRTAELAAEHLRVLHEHAPDAIVSIDAATGRFREGNRRALELLDVRADELTELGPVGLAPREQRTGVSSASAFAEHLAAAAAGGAPEFAWTVRTRAGVETPTEARLVRLPGNGAGLVRASFVDVTLRRELEARVRRAHALESSGRLAGAVAHEFNNLLTVILGSAESLGQREGPDPLLAAIIGSCERAKRMTRQLLVFSRHSTVKAMTIDLCGLVRRITPMLESAAGPRISLKTRLTATRPIHADPAQIELALINLVLNARDACPRGGEIRITAADNDVDRVALSVRDDGAGIPADVLPNVFDPFVTTKEAGLGTGLGLAAVREIVEQARGSIEVESSPGGGATFRATFPADPSAVPPAPLPVVRRVGLVGRGERLLLVEDDPAIRSMLRGALVAAGFAVEVAESGEQAVPALVGSTPPIDLLIADVVLPGVDGATLAQRFPSVPSILMSGYAEHGLDLAGLGRDRTELLRKPFAPSELVDLVARLLADSRGHAPSR